MTSIIFRCDASMSMGSGHVMRCRTLARELKQHAKTAIFICRRQTGDLIHLLDKEFQVLSLPEQGASLCGCLEGRQPYSAWLGCSQEVDALQSLETIAEAGITEPAWVVVDHYGLDEEWESIILEGLISKNGVPKLLIIDDLADRKHYADLILDQNFYGDVAEKRYKDLVPDRCQMLLGPKYALLGREYALLHPLVPTRSELRRVLIFFGGVDTNNHTSLAIEALLEAEFSEIAVDVVLGHHSPHAEAVKGLVARRPFTKIHAPLPSLAGLIGRADLAIGAGGSTTWERFCLRCPSITTIIADNQRELSTFLELQGLAEVIDGPAKDYRSSLVSCMNGLLDQKRYNKKARSGIDLCTGEGAAIVANEMVIKTNEG